MARLNSKAKIGNKQDLVGQRFSKLVVTSFYKSKKGERYWWCECDCGNLISVSTERLRSGNNRSCGCLKRSDISGQVFGKLTAIRFVGTTKSSGNGRKAIWECFCECGNFVQVTTDTLKTGRKKTCGCGPRGPKAVHPKDRFWDLVDKQDEEGCWLWKGSIYDTGMGYGVLSYQSKHLQAHRVSYELEYGEIPVGLCVLHKCDNPPCVRPDHLFLGTRKDNAEDRHRKGRTRTDAMSWELVDEARFRYKNEDVTGLQLAKEYGVSGSFMHQILDGKSWKESTRNKGELK